MNIYNEEKIIKSEELKNQIKDLKELTKKKEFELNSLMLKENKCHFLSFHISMSQKKKLEAIRLFENLFKIKFTINKGLFNIKEAHYYDFESNNCLLDVMIDKYGIRIDFCGAYEDDEIKEILINTMLVVKKSNAKKDYLGVTGIKDIFVPEIENESLRIIKL